MTPAVSRLYRFAQLPLGDQLLLLAAVLLRPIFAVGVHLLPFRCWRPLLSAPLSKDADKNGAPVEPAARGAALRECVARAVSRTEAVVPVGACLARALTGYTLLTLLGQRGQVRVGVSWGTDRRLHSHAWLESHGRVLIGGPVHELRVLPLAVHDMGCKAS